MGETSIVHDADRIGIYIDLSAADLPPLSQIRYFSTNSQEELDYEIFEISLPQKLGVAGPLNVALYEIKT